MAKHTYLYKKPVGKECHHDKLTMKSCVIGIWKKMIQVKKPGRKKGKVKEFLEYFPEHT